MPDPELYGCELLKPGTQVLLSERYPIPDVVATLEKGAKIRGVTLPDMLAIPVTPGMMAPGKFELRVQEPSPSLVSRWGIANEWIQEKCSFETEIEVLKCFDQQTKIWTAMHPDVTAIPWGKSNP